MLTIKASEGKPMYSNRAVKHSNKVVRVGFWNGAVR